jgi:hypothetical protein
MSYCIVSVTSYIFLLTLLVTGFKKVTLFVKHTAELSLQITHNMEEKTVFN